MNTKKITIIAIFIFAVIYADSAVAQQWTPLVRIPGLPATGTVNLSMYLVGLYNFLLSIVGIVAVMMLIVGGMRYITAVGNPTAISDAKDIINNAIVGLLLALLSWVFVSTINPDVLYIKAPGSAFNTATDIDLGACYKSYTAPDCTCKNDNVVSASVDESTCNIDCKDDCSYSTSHPCIESDPVLITDTSFVSAGGKCNCIDGNDVEPSAMAFSNGVDCNEVCSDIIMASDGELHCGWNYLAVRVNINGEVEKTPYVGGLNLYYELSSTESELMDMFLTNEGGWNKFMNKPTSYNDGIHTYECAIMVVGRRVTLAIPGDYMNYFWVLPGTIIHADAFSLERDLCGKFAQCCHRDGAIGAINACKVEDGFYLPKCDSTYPDNDNCAISRSTIGSEDTIPYWGASKLFKARYTDDKLILSDCYSSNKGLINERSCELAVTRSYQFNTDLMCSPFTGTWLPI